MAGKWVAVGCNRCWESDALLEKPVCTCRPRIIHCVQIYFLTAGYIWLTISVFTLFSFYFYMTEWCQTQFGPRKREQMSFWASSWFKLLIHYLPLSLTNPHTYYYCSIIIYVLHSGVSLPMTKPHTHTHLHNHYSHSLRVLKALFSKIHHFSSLWYNTVSLFFFFQSIHVYSVSCSLELWRDTLNGWSC